MTTTADLIRLMGGEPPNTNTATATAYGVAALNDLAEWVAEELEGGTYIGGFEAPTEIQVIFAELREQLARECPTIAPREYSRYGEVDCLYEAPDEDFLYRLETEVDGPDGKPGRLVLETGYLGGAILVWVEESPWLTFANECSPCVPCGGNLRPPHERDGEGDGFMVTYDLPPDWWDAPYVPWCDQCSFAAVNGVMIHEAGCPNDGKVRGEDGSWYVDKDEEDW